jgi:hypothetical protein
MPVLGKAGKIDQQVNPAARNAPCHTSPAVQRFSVKGKGKAFPLQAWTGPWGS